MSRWCFWARRDYSNCRWQLFALELLLYFYLFFFMSGNFNATHCDLHFLMDCKCRTWKKLIWICHTLHTFNAYRFSLEQILNSFTCCSIDEVRTFCHLFVCSWPVKPDAKLLTWPVGDASPEVFAQFMHFLTGATCEAALEWRPSQWVAKRLSMAPAPASARNCRPGTCTRIYAKCTHLLPNGWPSGRPMLICMDWNQFEASCKCEKYERNSARRTIKTLLITNLPKNQLNTISATLAGNPIQLRLTSFPRSRPNPLRLSAK